MRQIHLGRVLVLQGEMFHVPDYADDFPHLIPAVVSGHARLDPLADDVLTGIEFAREALVHDHDRRRLESISFVEDAAPPHRDAHGLEVVGRDDTDRCGCALTFRQRTFFDVEGSGHVVATQGQGHDRAR